MDEIDRYLAGLDLLPGQVQHLKDLIVEYGLSMYSDGCSEGWSDGFSAAVREMD